MPTKLSGKQIPSTMPITFRVGHIWFLTCNMKMCLGKYKQKKKMIIDKLRLKTIFFGKNEIKQ